MMQRLSVLLESAAEVGPFAKIDGWIEPYGLGGRGSGSCFYLLVALILVRSDSSAV
jgi:hypothetical protein